MEGKGKVKERLRESQVDGEIRRGTENHIQTIVEI